MKKILIFDTNWLINKSYFIYKNNYSDNDLTVEKNRIPFVRKVFIDICSVIRKMKISQEDEVWFSFDNNSSYARTKFYDGYKSNREFDELFTSLVKEIYSLVSQKTNALRIKDVESDDIISLLCKHYSQINKSLIIVFTGDADMNQLVSEKVIIYKSANKKEQILIHFNDFDRHLLSEIVRDEIEIKSINPKIEVIEKILFGCKSDNIPRLIRSNFGPKKFEKLLQKIDLTQSIYQIIESICSELRYSIDDTLLFNQDMLVNLKFSNQMLDEIQRAHFNDAISKEKVRNFCESSNLTFEYFLKNTKYVSEYV